MGFTQPAPAAKLIRMLREIKKISQHPDEDRRRWFSDSAHDLIVWQRGGDIRAFELCYGKGMVEHALRWSPESGLEHFCVDDGEDCAMRPKMAPILQARGVVDFDRVRHEFEQAAQQIDAGITAFVARQLGPVKPRAVDS